MAVGAWKFTPVSAVDWLASSSGGFMPWVVFQEIKGHERDAWARGAWVIAAVVEADGEDAACRQAADGPGRYAALEVNVVDVGQVPA